EAERRQPAALQRGADRIGLRRRGELQGAAAGPRARRAEGIRRLLRVVVALLACYLVAVVATALWLPFRTANSNTAAYFREDNFFLHFDPKWGLMNRPNHSFRRTIRALNGEGHSFDIHYDDIGARVDAPGRRSGRDGAL